MKLMDFFDMQRKKPFTREQLRVIEKGGKNMRLAMSKRLPDVDEGDISRWRRDLKVAGILGSISPDDTWRMALGCLPRDVRLVEE